MSAAILSRAVGFLFHPNHARGEREFVVTIRPEGSTTSTEVTVWATSSFDAIDKVIDEHGNVGRFTARAL